MLEVLKTLSDDQIALVGCATALLLMGTIMSLSYYIGRGRMTSAGQKARGSVAFESEAGRSQPIASPEVATRRRDAA
ncbi:MAG TPA: hypothetical protein VG055_25170 [Planctomycetaceae bacterium]|jgi:hypothetical protein|nr:hypothetical protein [Planctomycetaceae bacterium]